MMPVTASIKVNPELKREAQELFDSMELTFSAAVNIFLRQCVREQAIPFRIGSPVYNEETLRTIQEARRGENMDRCYSSVEEYRQAFEAGKVNMGR